jgi:hypothetical protein
MESNDQPSDLAGQDDNPVTEMAVPRIMSYNFSEGKRPGGMRVRAKIRVVTGRNAAVLDAVQAEAIRGKHSGPPVGVLVNEWFARAGVTFSLR